MKKYPCIFIALAAVMALFISGGPALAYTVTGDLSTTGFANL
jgi:hypothetical protein